MVVFGHAWCLQAAGTTQRESGEVEYTPEAVEAWVGQLCQRFGNRPIAVAVEQVKGALVFMLSKYEPLHLFPVPPAMSAKLRQALYPSGAKDDPRDADLVVDLLLQHRDKLRRLSPDSEATRQVQNLVEERRHLVEEKTAQSNRLTNHLKIYFPQMLEWFDRLDTELVCALLEQWPTLEELQRVPPARLRTFFRKQRCHYPELVERRLVGIRQAMPAIRDRAVIEAKSAVVKVSAQLIRSLIRGVADLDRKIEVAAAAHPDFFIFESLPGAGAVLAPRLLAALGSQRERYANAAEVQAYSGIAPVTERSGKKKWIHFRWACPKFCGRAFTSGRGIPSLTRNGREATINNSGTGARGTTRRCEGWPSNGFASSFVAGKIGSLMTRADIWPRSPNETHRSLRSLVGQSCEIFVDTL
jgi:transposase